nr:hypothetical protein [Tanacetum cinerariifolium]
MKYVSPLIDKQPIRGNVHLVELYTTDYCCSDGSLRDKIICDLNQTPDLSQRPPQNCHKCGNSVDGQYCQGCALLRKKFKEDLFTYCLENGILQDSSELSNDNTNVVNALQEPFFLVIHQLIREKTCAELLAEEQEANINTQPFQYSVIPQHPQEEMSVEFLQEKRNQIDYLKTFLRKFNRISFYEMPKVLSLAWEKILEIKLSFKDKHCQPEDILELFRRLHNDVQNIHEELAVYINTPNWDRHTICYSDDDDEDYDFIKSSVESLVPIPSESEGIPDNMCNVPFHNNSPPLDISKDQFKDFSDSNDDSTLIDDDSFSYQIKNVRLVELYTTDYCCSDGSLGDKIICDLNQTLDLSQRPPQNCHKCGNSVDGQYCQGCALLRKKFKEDLFTYCLENGILQDSSELSNNNTNVVNALQEPFVLNQDPDKNSSQINHHCCYGIGDALEDIFCHQCTCELCGNGAHYGYNCPPKVLIVPNSKPFNNQTVDELPPTVPSFDPTCYSEDENSFTYDSKFNLVHDSPNDFKPPLQPPIYSYEFCGNNAYYGHDCSLQVLFTYDLKPYEFIKSSVESLVPILSESEGIPDNMCNVPFQNNFPPLDISKDQFKDFSDSNDDSTSIDDDSFSIDNIENVEASPLDSELVSSEVMEIVILEVRGIDDDILLTIKSNILREKILNVNLLIANIEALKDNPAPSSDFMTKSSFTSLNSLLEETNTFDNSLPKFETFYFDLEEISSGSTITHSDISLPEYEAFYDDHVKEISSGSTTTHFDCSLYVSFIFDLLINPFPPADRSDVYEFADELVHIISPPKYDCLCFKNEPNSRDFTMDVVDDRVIISTFKPLNEKRRFER